ncbi:LytTR family DNA-binding domain-containing protein [Salipiger sp. PrR002]|uniref:LytTR family DNA-binding domain-containing protein n=1 Tax=Salipiger sp. PrR002 TaxID=2706489 RepID=UPI0013B7A040|nr:LytTR family DNA-binding domain-containing protein [Salipiger sp. PrR002]NDV97911.1 LytTR family transcriptional regulator [Salipiger sp. PrR002]NDW55402.1 LytTR family transcriptional regulator [Salipiger sp. PrR004]
MITDIYNRSRGFGAVLFEELDLRDIVWQRQSYTVAGHLLHYGQRRTWRYLSIVLVALVASDPVGLGGELSFPAYLLGWMLGMCCYLAAQVSLMLAAAALRRLLPRLPVYEPLISLLALVPTLALLDVGVEAFTGVSVGPFLADRLAYLWITVVMLETIFLRFVVTWDAGPEASVATWHAQSDTRPLPLDLAGGDALAESGQVDPVSPAVTTPSETATASRILLIGSQPVALDDLICLEARQHHVLARHSGGTLSQRARLSDIVAQTRLEEGLQPHRSWWVAAHALCQLERQDGKPVLRLTDGTLVPVARGRMADVERWLHGRPRQAA